MEKFSIKNQNLEWVSCSENVKHSHDFLRSQNV